MEVRDEFGESLLCADFNGDGYEDLVAGLPTRMTVLPQILHGRSRRA
jgi:hypothetical protein